MIVRIKRKVIAAAAITVCVGLLVCFLLTSESGIPTAATVSNWGLSFRKAGDPPAGNASAEYLKRYNAYFLGETSTVTEKTLYLTFDAGFENGNTAAILDALKKHDVKATFFLVKNYLDTAPELVQRMVAEGHTVGNHTATHPDMSKIADRAAFEKELGELETAYEQLIGAPMAKFYRPPQGKFSESNLQMAKDMGYHTFFGVWHTWIGTWINNLHGNRLLINCSPAFTRVLSYCFTVPPLPMRRF